MLRQIDPTNAYNHLTQDQIIHTCAWPLVWAMEWFCDPLGDLPTYLRDRYGFGELHHFDSSARLNAAGCMTYPGDPPLAPLVAIKGHGTLFMQFPYGIVYIATPETSFFTRMD